jgi:hypothetical protein
MINLLLFLDVIHAEIFNFSYSFHGLVLNVQLPCGRVLNYFRDDSQFAIEHSRSACCLNSSSQACFLQWGWPMNLQGLGVL